MKKFVVKYADGEKTFGEYESKEKASAKLIEFIIGMNKALDVDYFSPFDFSLEKIECGEVNEGITDFENARKDLDIEPNSDFVSANIADFARLVNEINPKHIEALIAINKLFTIAEAWNKADGFVPDFSDLNQNKWYPWFKYDKDAAGFVCANTINAPTTAYASFGSRLCFKSSARAAQFGKQFADLSNKLLLGKWIYSHLTSTRSALPRNKSHSLLESSLTNLRLHI